jgi:hypothetical protein
MTKEEIIEMAKQAGGYPAAETDRALLLFSESHIERFAKLLAEKEREACAERASIALLGTLLTTRDRVLNAIRARGQEC